MVWETAGPAAALEQVHATVAEAQADTFVCRTNADCPSTDERCQGVPTRPAVCLADSIHCPRD